MGKIINVGAYKINEMLKNEKVFVIDLRNKDDYNRGHIYGAINIPFESNIYQMYMIKIKEKSIPQNAKIVLYCERGSLSIACAKEMAHNGYTVYNLVGGYSNYKV